jgi:hypothetical protein
MNFSNGLDIWICIFKRDVRFLPFIESVFRSYPERVKAAFAVPPPPSAHAPVFLIFFFVFKYF